MDFPLKPWIAVIAPAETTRPIVTRLSAEISKIIRSPAFRDEHMLRQGLEPVGNTPEQFAEFLKEDRGIGAMLVKVSGIRLD
jgi:tripartite-type tricarboxylate transporter receptor subunit TctC